ncbi:extracellular solute-binding protein [Anaerocolumna xylanovorans]|uniref:Carbohydrate ABC transporter substrate-binding protein, CUT1 family n=1 Tax=Anaerocolumna xylanovorans DSM 12503 TaxID=1121345 RepID=A0A1M7Y2F4_9FIRM|nr:extracellular solute-binding protein [Anaerocolumna xylanovorans]SHO46073.1 carbohydrate ABC transporter substrate-binding protein, CUT1 family [Anaerocolumna xylanovorans DSM 12503]
MKSLKKILSMCLVTAMMCTMAACSSGGNGNQSGGGSGTADTGKSSKDKEKIVISCYLADDSQVAVREKYIDEPLKKAFPDVNIEIKMYNDRQSLQVEVAGGGGPDIMDLDGPTDVAEFAKGSRVLELGDYAEKYGWANLFYDWAYKSCFYNDKLYSLPTSFEGMVMYYNMDVMEKNGWEVPQTEDELVELMKKVKEKDIIPIAFGNSNYQGAVDWLYSTFSSCYAGPKAVKAAMEGNGKYTDAAIKDAFQTMVDWWKNGWIGDKASQSVTNEDMLAFFAEGKAAMMIDGTWASNQLLATYPDCNWDSEMMPAKEGIGPILPFATGGGYAINANSDNPDLAAEVLNYLFTSLDRHYQSIREAGYQPYPLKEFDISKLEGIDEKLNNQYKLLMDAQTNNQIGYCSWTFYPSDMRVYMNENTDALFLELLSVDDYLAKAQTYIDKAITDKTIPVLP